MRGSSCRQRPSQRARGRQQPTGPHQGSLRQVVRRPHRRRHLSRYDGGAGIGRSGSSALVAENVLSSPFLIRILPFSRPSLPSRTVPEPET